MKRVKFICLLYCPIQATSGNVVLVRTNTKHTAKKQNKSDLALK